MPRGTHFLAVLPRAPWSEKSQLNHSRRSLRPVLTLWLRTSLDFLPGPPAAANVKIAVSG